jgi:tight adherence protein B
MPSLTLALPTGSALLYMVATAVAFVLAFLAVMTWVRGINFHATSQTRLRKAVAEPRAVSRQTIADRWALRVRQWRDSQTAAALHLRFEEYWGVALGGGAVGAVIGLVLRGAGGSLGLGLVGVIGTLYWLRMRRERWLVKAEEQLPDFFRNISSSMRAGSSFGQALAVVGRDTPEPLGPEIRRLARREALGFTVEQALNELAQRVPSKDLNLAIVAIQVQRDVGGALSPLLNSIVDTIESRQRLKAEIRTLTAAGRMSGWILTVLPVALGFIIWFMDPAYIGTLFSQTVGNIMIAYAVASIIAGSVVINRMVKGPDL